MNWRERIVSTSETLAGKPHIKDTRISVELLVDWLANGWSFEQILESYPNIKREDILSGLAFAAEMLHLGEWIAVQRVVSLKSESLNAEIPSTSEIHFVVEAAPEGGFTARAIGVDIFTEAVDLPGLHQQLRHAVQCHLGADEKPSTIRLHIISEEALAT